MTKNELIVESCRNMAFQDLRDTLSSALDNRDATIAALRAEVERLKEQNGKLANSLAVRNQECNAARSAMLRTTTDSLKDYVNYKEARAATDADGGCE